MNLLAAFLCVFFFALTAPFTRLAALSISPESIILIRIIGASIVSGIYILKEGWVPPKPAWPGIIAASLGTVVGFNAFMAYGLSEVPSGHAAVALAGLPMATSIYSVIRDKRRPGVKFWIFAILGTFLSSSFFFFMNIKDLLLGDLLLLLSVICAALGYVEGGRLSRLYGGSNIMAWAILIAFPLALVLSIFHFIGTNDSFSDLNVSVWFSLIYVATISQSLGMFLWFKVLAIGPMEEVVMVQLLQPFITLVGAIVILDEQVLPVTWVVALSVALCVFGSNREKNKLILRK